MNYADLETVMNTLDTVLTEQSQLEIALKEAQDINKQLEQENNELRAIIEQTLSDNETELSTLEDEYNRTLTDLSEQFDRTLKQLQHQ